MTVSQLIKALMEYPPDTPTYARGHFVGVDDLRVVRLVRVHPNVNAGKGSALGPHKVLDGDKVKGEITGILLER